MSPVVKRAAGGLLVLAGTVIAVVVVWTAFLAVVDVSPFVAKTPLDVWTYLTSAANRAAMWPLLGRTLADAALGFAAGLGLSTAIALLFYFSGVAERMFLPALASLRAIPMVTVAPIIVLVFGREEAGTAVIGAAIVLVPALLTMLHGIRSAPVAGLDLCRAYGGTAWTAFTKVALPHAVPTWFTAARISVTTAIVGALLAQWLASGAGLGGQMMRDANEFQFDRLWASVVVLTVVCIAVYQLLALVETLVQSRLRSSS
ncbi:ABC transporter permease subunit [Streptosporangium sp. NBC_01810]|uniref:ABC transporter permease n=1 Tax=Streptosporangium sp. NBC_01810 TaxID=2975951 RepID=UPI002DDBA857|nr:ABC transporter permease subunit [Streptosporangium sp. NBC_01810]WSA25806.1 ABC transporter permease subunit [Streptosporangium sp. NBC_01810]